MINGGETGEKPATEVDGGDRVLLGSTRTFNSSNVNVLDGKNAIKMFGTGWERGEQLLFTSDATPPTGLTSGTIYYAVPFGRDIIRLARTRQEALAASDSDENDPNIIKFTSNGSGNHQLTLAVDGKPQWPTMVGSLTGSDANPLLTYSQPGNDSQLNRASFTGIEKLNVLLGLGDDTFTVDSSISELSVELRGGPGNDEFLLHGVPGDNTVILGESGTDDRIRVIVDGQPVPDSFTALTISAGIETLVIDNRSHTKPVDWVVSQGTMYFVDGRAGVTVDTDNDTIVFSGFTAPRALQNGDRVLLTATLADGSIGTLPEQQRSGSPGQRIELDPGQFYIVRDLDATAGTFKLSLPGVNTALDLTSIGKGTLSLRRISALVNLEGAERSELIAAENQTNTLSVVTPLNATVDVANNTLSIIEGARVLDHESNLTRDAFPIGRVDGLQGVQSVVTSTTDPFVFAAGTGEDKIALFIRVADPTADHPGSRLVYVDAIDSINGHVPSKPSKLELSPDSKYLYVLGGFSGSNGNTVLTVYEIGQQSNGDPKLTWKQDLTGSTFTSVRSKTVDSPTNVDLPAAVNLTLKFLGLTDLVFSPDGTRVFVTGAGDGAGEGDGIAIFERDPATGYLTKVLQKLRKENSFGKSVDVGNEPVDRQYVGPLADGNRVILDDPFSQAITANGTYRFYAWTASNITPLLFKPVSEDDHSNPDNLDRWEIVATGTRREIPGEGVYEFEFGLESGTVPNTAGLYFGWLDGGAQGDVTTVVKLTAGTSSNAFQIRTADLSNVSGKITSKLGAVPAGMGVCNGRQF